MLVYECLSLHFRYTAVVKEAHTSTLGKWIRRGKVCSFPFLLQLNTFFLPHAVNCCSTCLGCFNEYYIGSVPQR